MIYSICFNSPQHLERFQSYLNSRHAKIQSVNKANLQTLSTTNQLSAEFILILTVSYHPPTKSACLIHCYKDVPRFAHIGLSFT